MSRDDFAERVAKLEERVFEQHTDSINSLKEEFHGLRKQLWLVIVVLSANFGTGIMGLLK